MSEQRACTCGSTKFKCETMSLVLHDVPVWFEDSRMEYDDVKGDSDGWDRGGEYLRCIKCGKEYIVHGSDGDATILPRYCDVD